MLVGCTRVRVPCPEDRLWCIGCELVAGDSGELVPCPGADPCACAEAIPVRSAITLDTFTLPPVETVRADLLVPADIAGTLKGMPSLVEIPLSLFETQL